MKRVNKIKELEKIAVRIRKHAISSVHYGNSGHIGGSLSSADILTVLYFNEMNIDPQNPNWKERDRFILSKGHAAPALYACMAERGFFSVEELKKYRTIDSYLEGHQNTIVPGCDITTGSLGMGLSSAVGMAIAAKLNKKNYRVYVIIGDGECQEGQLWEAAMFASHQNLNNVVVFLDDNKLQAYSYTQEIMNGSLSNRFKAFGWHTINIDGHDIQQILDALTEAKEVDQEPVMIIADTIKGKGVSFMENTIKWHGTVPNREEYEKAVDELNNQLREM